MAKYRGSSRSIISSSGRILAGKPSLAKIAFYLIFLSAFTVFVFVFNTSKIQDDDPRHHQFVSEESQLHSLQNSDNLRNPYDEQRSQKLGDVQNAVEQLQLWTAPFSYGLQQCVKPTAKYRVLEESNHYITVRSNGGLNQMRTGIADMVAVARIMNATIVIPQLDKRSFWQDSSTFSDIFDEVHFIQTLDRDVRVIKELPKELESVPRARKHFTSWSGVGYYEEMTSLWKDYQVIHVAKSDSRLANNDLPLDIQRLRCRALYTALHFSPAIETLGKKLVERLKLRAGRYIALHLRYEKDMLSFTGCTYGLTDAESEELRIMRESTSHWKVKNINSTQQRMEGFCPLTPKEVGIFLKALGYSQSTVIYIAAGEIYGGDNRLSELRSHFPNIVFKEMLATQKELKGFTGHATKTAALDYIISVESDVFVPSHVGNMAIAVEGHRRFLGHRRTITPDRKGLVRLFDKLESGQLKESSKLSKLVQKMHKDRQGAPRKRKGPVPGIKGRARFRTEESFYQNPYPECICSSKNINEHNPEFLS